MSASPSLSIVIEWENAGRIGCDRAQRMIAELHRQLTAVPPGQLRSVEILLVFEASQVGGETLKKTMESHGQWPAIVRYLPSPVSGYYEQKNFGTEHAGGDIILFVDSDVVPEPGWLQALLAPFWSHDAKIVAGATSVERQGFYSTAMALGWIFPMPPADKDVRPAPLFYANNVAFRREMIDQMRFPQVDQYRSQVGMVHRGLAAGGHRILMNGAAAVLHPPPRGFIAFVTRALWCGYDEAASLPRRARSVFVSGPRIYVRQVGSALARVVNDGRRAGLGLAGIAAALFVVGAYQAIRFFGFLGGLLAPSVTWRQLRRIAP